MKVFSFDAHAVLAQISQGSLPAETFSNRGKTEPLAPPDAKTLAGLAALAGVRASTEKAPTGKSSHASDPSRWAKTNGVGAFSGREYQAGRRSSPRPCLKNTASPSPDKRIKPRQIGRSLLHELSPDGTAKVAKVAKAGLPSPDLGAFEERAAVAEYDGGMSREEAERVAAAEQGYSNPNDLYAAMTEFWRHHLELLARDEASVLGKNCTAAALAFIRGGWAEKAVALGWSEIELFGVELHEPSEPVGAAYLPFAPSTVTAECITYFRSSEPAHRRWRQALAADAVLPWDIDDHGSRSSVPT